MCPTNLDTQVRAWRAAWRVFLWKWGRNESLRLYEFHMCCRLFGTRRESQECWYGRSYQTFAILTVPRVVAPFWQFRWPCCQRIVVTCRRVNNCSSPRLSGSMAWSAGWLFRIVSINGASCCSMYWSKATSMLPRWQDLSDSVSGSENRPSDT